MMTRQLSCEANGCERRGVGLLRQQAGSEAALSHTSVRSLRGGSQAAQCRSRGQRLHPHCRLAGTLALRSPCCHPAAVGPGPFQPPQSDYAVSAFCGSRGMGSRANDMHQIHSVDSLLNPSFVESYVGGSGGQICQALQLRACRKSAASVLACCLAVCGLCSPSLLQLVCCLRARHSSAHAKQHRCAACIKLRCTPLTVAARTHPKTTSSTDPAVLLCRRWLTSCAPLALPATVPSSRPC